MHLYGRTLEGYVTRALPAQHLVALDALLENAVKYTDAGDAIELRSRRVDSGVAIEIEDAGCGIPQDALAHIWDRFARADAARTRAHGGVGLGLAIVDAISKGHGGTCTVHVAEGATTFALSLPRFRTLTKLLAPSAAFSSTS